MIKKISLLAAVLLISLLTSCDGDKKLNNRVIMGIPADVNSFNPLFASTVDEGAISELLFLSPADFTWNPELGELEAHSSLAERWEWAGDSSSITFYLRNGLTWSDGVSLTSEDIVFSLVSYSDPEVSSRLFGAFDDLYLDEKGQIDEEKTFVIESPTELRINFKPESFPKLVDISHPIIPKHIYENIERKDFQTAEANFSPVSNGPFVLKKWDRNQSITLTANKNSFLYDSDNIDEIIFKIIPDYTSRITQLKNGEIDLMELITAEDVQDLKALDNLNIVTIDGREYDYIGWNNIDTEALINKGKFYRHKFFGSKNVRIAMTHAINRQEILEQYLYNYGSIASTPVSPIFKQFYHNGIKPYLYDPARAKELLKLEGWSDSNNNGIVDKKGLEFEFTLYSPAGNPLRDYTATIIKNNLKAVGVEMKYETLEIGAFIDNLVNKRMDAWMAAWFIPIPLDLNPSWNSDLQKGFMNFETYRNGAVDRILNQLNKNLPLEKEKELYYSFQERIHIDKPITFMYWISNIIGINNRVKNVTVSPLGIVTHCWEWSVD